MKRWRKDLPPAEFVLRSSMGTLFTQTGHDAKREGIVSVPQNITIKYITEDGEGGGEGGAEDDGEDDDGGGEDGAAETLYMTQEQQNAIHSLISIPQQHGSGGGGGVPMQVSHPGCTVYHLR